MPPLKLGRISRRFGFLLATLHLTSLAITVGKLCLVHADSSFFQSPSLSDTDVQLAPTTVYSQIIVNSLRQKRNRCKKTLYGLQGVSLCWSLLRFCPSQDFPGGQNVAMV